MMAAMCAAAGSTLCVVNPPRHVPYAINSGKFSRKVKEEAQRRRERRAVRKARQQWPQGQRVRVCDNPKCGHSAGITGLIDLVGYFDQMTEICVTVLRDGGGMCGPFRLHELRRI